MKRHLLMPWRPACYHAFCRLFPQIMQFNAMELKIGVSGVENGFGISLSVTLAEVCLWSAGLK